MTCLILSTAVQCRQSKARKTLPVPVGERHRQGLGSVSDHRTYHTPFRTTRKQHGQRGLKMKWSGAETAKNNRKHSEKVPGACSHRRGQGFESLQVHQKRQLRRQLPFVLASGKQIYRCVVWIFCREVEPADHNEETGRGGGSYWRNHSQQ